MFRSNVLSPREAAGCTLDCLTVRDNEGAREFRLGVEGVPWALRSADRALAWRGELESRAKGLDKEWRGDFSQEERRFLGWKRGFKRSYVHGCKML